MRLRPTRSGTIAVLSAIFFIALLEPAGAGALESESPAGSVPRLWRACVDIDRFLNSTPAACVPTRRLGSKSSIDPAGGAGDWEWRLHECAADQKSAA